MKIANVEKFGTEAIHNTENIVNVSKDVNQPPSIFGYGSLLIESQDESDEQLRTFLEGLIRSIYGKIPEWLSFRFGGQYEKNGILFRQFLCPAGSVDGRIRLYAEEATMLRRAIIYKGTRDNLPLCLEIRNGVTTEFNCDDLRLVNHKFPDSK